jgi:translation elongation factor EF-1alpha
MNTHYSQRAIHKHEREARDIGKSSFYLAWVMDEDEQVLTTKYTKYSYYDIFYTV